MAHRRNQQKEANLASMVESGPQGAYEALQLYRSRAIRQKSKNLISEALKTCNEGTVLLLKYGYETAGAELAAFLLELFVELNIEGKEEYLKMLYDIDNSFPSNSSSKIAFLKECIKWTTAVGDREHGDPLFHRRLAEALWNTKDKNAPLHFALGEAPELYNQLIMKTYGEPNQAEQRERALTIGIVNFLALENLRDANELFKLYQKEVQSKGLTPATPSELITFCDYLLQTCRRDAQPLFKSIVNAYASVVDFDESVPTLLMGPIANRLFGIKPKVNPMFSMLQQMLS